MRAHRLQAHDEAVHGAGVEAVVLGRALLLAARRLLLLLLLRVERDEQLHDEARVRRLAEGRELAGLS